MSKALNATSHASTPAPAIPARHQFETKAVTRRRFGASFRVRHSLENRACRQPVSDWPGAAGGGRRGQPRSGCRVCRRSLRVVGRGRSGVRSISGRRRDPVRGGPSACAGAVPKGLALGGRPCDHLDRDEPVLLLLADADPAWGCRHRRSAWPSVPFRAGKQSARAHGFGRYSRWRGWRCSASPGSRLVTSIPWAWPSVQARRRAGPATSLPRRARQRIFPASMRWPLRRRSARSSPRRLRCCSSMPQPHCGGRVLGLGITVGVMSSVIPASLELISLRRLPAGDLRDPDVPVTGHRRARRFGSSSGSTWP